MRVVQMLVAHQSVTERRSYRCAHCGHTQDADVTGVGEGTQSELNAEGTAQRRALEDAKADVERAIGQARCPKCRARPPGADRRFWQPWVLLYVGCWIAGVVCGLLPTWLDLNMAARDRTISAWVMPLLFGGAATLIVPIVVYGKLHLRDKRVQWL